MGNCLNAIEDQITKASEEVVRQSSSAEMFMNEARRAKWEVEDYRRKLKTARARLKKRAEELGEEDDSLTYDDEDDAEVSAATIKTQRRPVTKKPTTKTKIINHAQVKA